MDPQSNDIENLQNDEQHQQMENVDEQTENLEQQQGAESDPASEPEHEQNAAGTEQKHINQEAVNEAIAKQHAKYREEQRRSQQLEAENQRLRQGQLAQQDPEPSIPEVDPYADDVADQVKQRDEAIRAHMAWQQRQQQRQLQAQEYQTRTMENEQAEAAERAERFFSRANEDKVDQTQLTQAVTTVGQYQLGQEVAKYLMDDDKGHQITMQLSKDPTMLAELSLMQPYERILHIERNVRSKLDVKPRQSKGNPPPKRVKGKASDVTDAFPLTGGKVTIK